MRIPADVEREDRILANLTARQLAILSVAAVVLWAGYTATRHLVPLAVFGALALPLGAVAAMLALGRFEGVAADRWVTAAWRHHRAPAPARARPRRRPARSCLRAGLAGPLPAPLRLPLVGVPADGVVDLGTDGLALVCRASAVTFALRTPTEQEALVAGFARFLNSLAEPIQILVRAEPVDLSPTIDRLLEDAPGPPAPRPGGRRTRPCPVPRRAGRAPRPIGRARCWSCCARRAPRTRPGACTGGPPRPPRPSARRG